jgi:hypothetical protein
MLCIDYLLCKSQVDDEEQYDTSVGEDQSGYCDVNVARMGSPCGSKRCRQSKRQATS